MWPALLRAPPASLCVSRQILLIGVGHPQPGPRPAVVSARPSRTGIIAAPMARTLDPETLGDHIDRLFRAAWALCGSREDAEDLVQETYERVLRRPRFVRRDDALGYLYLTLLHTYFNARRAAARRPQAVAGLDQVAPASARAETQPEQAAEINLVFAAVAGLPQPMREALV